MVVWKNVSFFYFSLDESIELEFMEMHDKNVEFVIRDEESLFDV